MKRNFAICYETEFCYILLGWSAMTAAAAPADVKDDLLLQIRSLVDKEQAGASKRMERGGL